MVLPFIPERLYLKDYIPLKCKKCGNKKHHTLGNIKHTLNKNPNHCRCRKCCDKAKAKITSDRLLKIIEEELDTSAEFHWVLNKLKVKANKIYSQKTPLPLICKTCQNEIQHTPSNIKHCLKNNGYIKCQVCKLRNAWKEKIKHITSNIYELDTQKTVLGFKIIHKKCGHYYYANNPHLIKRCLCPFCYNLAGTILKLKDESQFTTYVNIKSAGKVEFHTVDKENKILTISCVKHPKGGQYKITWNAFARLKRKSSTFSCNTCIKQALRETSYHEYNNRIKQFNLEIDNRIRNIKLDTKQKIQHRCLAKNYHPPFYASPYEIEFKNKRCLYCYTNVAYHKDYNFIKRYIEMDEDRFFSHCGRKFKLLSTKEEIEAQLKPGKHITSIKIRVNELTCLIHDEYETSWGNFYHHNASCSKCSGERYLSYAHSYCQALLAYFNFDYIPEYPVKIGQTTYRVDFKLPTAPNYLEIDSAIHVNDNNWWHNNTGNETYIERDTKKNAALKNNIERIKLYDAENRIISLKDQLSIIETSILDRARRNHIHLTGEDIEAAKKDPGFFNHARIVYRIKKLSYFHENHIEFGSNNPLSILHAREDSETEFYCKVNKRYFKRKLITVASLSFTCPVCKRNILERKQQDYYLDQKKINEIKDIVDNRFKGKILINPNEFGNRAYFFKAVILPVSLPDSGKEIYMPLRDLVHLPVLQVMRRLKSNEYDKYLKKKSTTRKNSVYIIKESNSPKPNKPLIHKLNKRLERNQVSEIKLAVYQKTAKTINQIMRSNDDTNYIERLIEENESKYNTYIHRSEEQALKALVLYDERILPFFVGNEIFELLTSRNKYAYCKQYLLLRDLRCNHSFYASWSWIIIKLKNGENVQCQHKQCYGPYYSSRSPGSRKVPQTNILKIFKKMFHGQFYPVNPETKIMVRQPIEIIHLPSGTLLNMSVDNFRRGKFRSVHKKLSLKDIKKSFPNWTPTKSR